MTLSSGFSSRKICSRKAYSQPNKSFLRRSWILAEEALNSEAIWEIVLSPLSLLKRPVLRKIDLQLFF
jgi:arsenate reductase-like glutaredoxin family protein